MYLQIEKKNTCTAVHKYKLNKMLYPKYIGVTYHLYLTIQWLLTSLHNVTIVEMFNCIMLSLRNFDIFLGMSDCNKVCTRFYFALLVDLCRSQLICISNFAYCHCYKYLRPKLLLWIAFPSSPTQLLSMGYR